MISKISTVLTLLMLVSLVAACGAAQPTTINTPDVGVMETAIGGIPPATTAAIDDLIKMVNDFVVSGDITGNAENGLLAKLETIKQKIMNGQSDPAVNELAAFVNEVQAQLGNKISNAAATALIAKAQQFAAELQSGIPVTSASATLSSTTDTLTSTPETMELPTPMGDKLEHQAQWDVVVLQIAQAVGFTNFDYDLYKLPANTTWESTLAYYQDQAATAGWGDVPTQTNEIAGGHYAVWSVTVNGKTDYFVVAQMDTPQGNFTLNISSK